MCKKRARETVSATVSLVDLAGARSRTLFLIFPKGKYRK